MSWTVPVAAEVHFLFFKWHDSGTKELLYNIAVTMDTPSSTALEAPLDTPSRRGEAEDLSSKGAFARTSTATPAVMDPPSVNVSSAGTVPKDPQTLALHLPCTGALSGQVHVTLNINVTASRPSHLPTVLYFRRRKICLKGLSPRTAVVGNRPTEGPRAWRVEHLTVVVGVAAGAVAVVATVTAAAVAWCSRARHTKQRNAGAPVQTVFTVDQKIRSVTRTTLLSPSTSSLRSPLHLTTPSTSIHNKSDVSHTQTTHHNTPDTTFMLQNTRPALRNTPDATFPYPTQHTNEATGRKFDTTCALSMHPTPNVHTPLSCSTHHTPILYTPTCHNQVQAAHPPGGAISGHKNGRMEKLSTTPDGSAVRRRQDTSVSMAEIRTTWKHLEVDPSRVRLSQAVLRGDFCDLFSGTMLPGDEVLVKRLRSSAARELTAAVECASALRLCAVQHTAVMTVTAVSTASPVMLVYPDYGLRNLKLFLRERTVPLTPEDLQQMALQVAQGLAHLHSCNITHADVAARNCLVTAQYQVKVSDGAFAKNLFPGDYLPLPEDHASDSDSSSSSSSISSSSSAHPETSTQNSRPVAWMALEAITDDSVSMPADVWSWGVVAWELCSLAQQPYDGLTSAHLTEYLKDGYRLAQPPTCPDVLYQLMAFCWALNPSHRPRAALLVDYLTGLTQEGIFSGLASSAIARDPLSSGHGAAAPFVAGMVDPKNEVRSSNANSCIGSSSTSSTTPTENEATVNVKNGRISKTTADLDGAYSSPGDVPALDTPPGLSHFPSTVYSTPTSLAGDLPWKLPEKRSSLTETTIQPRKDNELTKRPEAIIKEVPPPLPPDNPPSSVAFVKLRNEVLIPPRPSAEVKESPISTLQTPKPPVPCIGMRKQQRPKQPLPEGARHHGSSMDSH